MSLYSIKNPKKVAEKFGSTENYSYLCRVIREMIASGIRATRRSWRNGMSNTMKNI